MHPKELWEQRSQVSRWDTWGYSTNWKSGAGGWHTSTNWESRKDLQAKRRRKRDQWTAEQRSNEPLQEAIRQHRQNIWAVSEDVKGYVNLGRAVDLG